MLFTDCKSLFDHMKRENAVPDDKWIAVPVASLRGAISAGPGRDTRKAEARWVPSRWQLADCLTKKGLSAGFRETMKKGYTRLHEMSLQHVKRNKVVKSAAKFASYEADTLDMAVLRHRYYYTTITASC